MKRSSKNRNMSVQQFQLSGGLNFSALPSEIRRDESQLLYNIIYKKDSDTPIVRPAIACVTAAALASPIEKLHHYIKDATTEYTVCVSGQKLHYLNTDAWVEIGAVATDKPDMITFNGKLLIADGAGIQRWDGTAYDTATTAIKPTCLIEINNRVFANNTDSTGLDGVYCSGVEDETAWTFTEVGGAVMVRCGYGDGLRVVGIANGIQNEVIVFKEGGGSYKTYRIPIDLTPYTDEGNGAWGAQLLFGSTGASSPHNIALFDRVISYLSNDGFEAIAGVDGYSELMTGRFGKRINPAIITGNNPDFHELSYVPELGSIWIVPKHDKKVYLYHPWNGGKFTSLTFWDEQIRTVCQAGNTVYLAGDSGYLYRLDESRATDQVAPAEEHDLYGLLETKNLAFYGQALVKKAQVFFDPITSGSMSIQYVSATDITEIASGDIFPESSIHDLFTWDADLMDATEDLYRMGQKPWVYKDFQRWRGDDLTIRLIIKGRCGVPRISATIAEVGR